MTITLGSWLIPLIITFGSTFLAFRPRNSNYYGYDIADVLVATLLVVGNMAAWMVWMIWVRAS